MASANALSIGALSKATGTTVEAIRWYERVGVLAAPASWGSRWITSANCSSSPTSKALRPELRDLITQCCHGTVAECRIVPALSPKTEVPQGL